MSARQDRAELEGWLKETGLPWAIESGRRHLKVFLCGRMIQTLPHTGSRTGDRTHRLNCRANIRRVARELAPNVLAPQPEVKLQSPSSSSRGAEYMNIDIKTGLSTRLVVVAPRSLAESWPGIESARISEHGTTIILQLSRRRGRYTWFAQKSDDTSGSVRVGLGRNLIPNLASGLCWRQTSALSTVLDENSGTLTIQMPEEMDPPIRITKRTIRSKQPIVSRPHIRDLVRMVNETVVESGGEMTLALREGRLTAQIMVEYE